MGSACDQHPRRRRARVGHPEAGPRPHPAAVGRGARARRRAASRGRAPAGPAARARRPRHGQDHDPRRGDGRAAAGTRPRCAPTRCSASPSAAEQQASGASASRPVSAAGSSPPSPRSTRSPTRSCGRRPTPRRSPSRCACCRAPSRRYACASSSRAPCPTAASPGPPTSPPRSARAVSPPRCAPSWPRRARLGLDPWDLEALAAHAGSVGPAWKAVGEFLGDYLDVLDAEGVTDYTEVVHRAGLLAHDPEVQAQLRSQYSVVLVDEFQDTDPAQVRLLQGLVGPSTSFVVVGDPDQSIYAFRGADIGGILGFRETFRASDGSGSPVIVLRRTRRFGPVLREAAARVLRTTSLAPLPATIVYDHRHPVCEAPAYGEGSLEVRTYDSEHAEAAHVADHLRRAHLEHGVPWSDMAVLVRSGRRSIPTLRRALLSAGVPVEVASDEVPLHDEPALAPLLTLLRVAVDLGQPQGPPDVGAVDDDTVHTLLLSPLGDADPADVRRLGGVLRRLARETDPDQRPAPSGELLRRLLVDLVADPATVLPVQQSATGRDARARHAQDRRRARRPAAARGARRDGAAGQRRGGALDGVVGRLERPRRVGMAAAPRAGGPARWRRRTSRRLRPRRGPRAVRRGRAGRGPLRRAPRRRQLPGRARLPGDPGRHARRARHPRARRPPAHRAPREGTAVAARRGARRAGRRVARPPSPWLAPAGRPSRAHRARRGRTARGAARGGASSLLRRLHAGAGVARRLGGALEPRRRPAALALPRRARSAGTTPWATWSAAPRGRSR